jgi:acetyl esterase/lipase
MKLSQGVLVLVLFLQACGGSGGSSGSPAPSVSTNSETETTSTEPTETSLYWGGGDSQFGVLHLPSDTSKPVSTVLMIHGGCWSSPFTYRLQTPLSQELARRGYAVWNIEFRRLGNGGAWPTIFQDVAAATDHLRQLVSDYEYNLDLDRVTAIGHSSGGHLALWVTNSRRLGLDSPLYRPNPMFIRGVIPIAPVVDLESPVCAASVADLIGRDDLDDNSLATRLAETSPIDMLPSDVASIVISGENDTVAPPPITQSYVDAALNAGDLTEHIVLNEADHFDVIEPEFLDMNLVTDAIEQVQARTGLPR